MTSTTTERQASLPRDVRVRPRRPKDLPACVRLLRLVHYADRYPDAWPAAPRAWLDDEVTGAWVADRLGQVLGHVAIAPLAPDPASSARWCEITGRAPAEMARVSRFYVRPSARGRGVGSALLDVATSAIRARGLVPVLETVSANRDGIPFLRDHDWQLRAIDGWGRDGLYLYRYVRRG